MRNDRKSFRSDRRGTATIEFAFIAPILILFYFAVVELSLLLEASRKVSTTTSVIGDLVAQTDETTPQELNAILDAADAVMQPLSVAGMEIRVTSARMDLDGDIEVTWSVARNTSAHACGAALAPPEQVLTPGQSVIIAEVAYDYHPPIGELVTGDVRLEDVFYLRPRRSLEVKVDPEQC